MFAQRLRSILSAGILLCAFTAGRSGYAYSLLTHEQLVDLTWQSSIVPLLRSHYPGITAAQLEHARAFAYGGCVIQDIGYYPLGDEFFSDLTHYVRSGDFVVNLFRDAVDADELAFAAGALSHYMGDSLGHADATNLAVPVEFPRLRHRFGPVVNYAEGEHQHVQTEFAFDINEIAHHRLAPLHYLRHVGFEVPVRQVSLAFYQTYGLRVDFSTRRAARVNVRAFRFAARTFIPRVAYAETVLHRAHEPVEQPGTELTRLDAMVTKVSEENHWAEYRRKPGFVTYTLAGLIYVAPKFGKLKLLAIKGPNADTAKEYVHSVLASVDALDYALRRFTPKPTADIAEISGVTPAAARSLLPDPRHPPVDHALVDHPLVNRDLDTGSPVRPAGYRLTDDTYAELLARLTATPKDPIPPGIRADITAYYADLALPFATRKKPAAWAAVQTNLTTLKTMPTSAQPDPYPTFDSQTAPPASPE